MLKTKIIEALQANMPDEKSETVLSHAADAVMEIYVQMIAEAIAKAVRAYEGKPKENE